MKNKIILGGIFLCICISCQKIDFKESCDAYFKYNLKGNVKEIKESSGYWNSKFKWYESLKTFCFNNSGNLKEKLHASKIDTLEYNYFNYDKNGCLISEIEFIKSYLYDDEDITEKKYSLINDTLTVVKVNFKRTDLTTKNADTTHYEGKICYDTVGNKILELYPNIFHTEINRTTYKYDSLNRLIEEKKMSEYTHENEKYISLEGAYIYHYDNRGRVIEKIHYNGMKWGTDLMDRPYEVYKVEYGKLIKQNNAYPLAIEYEDYRYNEHGDIIEKHYRIEGDQQCEEEFYKIYHEDLTTLETITTYQYEYDEFNNWVFRLTYENGNLKNIDKRVIAYYGGKKTKATESFIQEAEIIQQKRDEQQRQLAENQPIQLVKVMEHGFEAFKFRFWGTTYNSVGYKLKCKLKNISRRTFVKAEFVNKQINFWGDAMRNPYITIELNNTMRLSCVNFGGSFDNWKKTREIRIPEINFDSPWRPSKQKEIALYFQPDVTRGFYWGIEGYGELLQRVHFKYIPTECTLNIPIYLEDATGYKKQINICLDIIDDYKEL